MRLKSLLATLTTAVLSPYFFALPAHAGAAPVPSIDAEVVGDEAQLLTVTCPGKTMCLWDDRNFGGDLIFQAKALGLHGVGWSNNDDASSGWNKTLYSAWLYFDANGAGNKYCLPSGYAHSNFDNVPGLNDEISSVEIVNRNCPSGSATIGSFKGY